MPLEYERVEPSSGADPDRRPYEGRATAVCDGRPPRRASPGYCVRKARFERASREV